jgi:alpha-beta hydrolase superfamily lysophospholipase
MIKPPHFTIRTEPLFNSLKTSFAIADSTGKKLHTYKWVPEGEQLKGVVQVAHGLAEHAGRYSQFASVLNRAGFAVYAHDHRGHGNTDPDNLGYSEVNNAFEQMVENIEDVRQHLTRVYPDLPHIMFGHSMGSFLLQRYMQVYDFEPAAIIYSGSSGKPPATLSAGIFLTNIIRRLRGDEAQSLTVHKMVFGAYNKKFEPADTEFDWLSRDPELVDLYIDDRFCGFVPAASFYNNFFIGLQTLHSQPSFAGSCINIPVLLVSGSEDPVSNGEKGVRNLEKLLRDSGVRDVTVNIYPGGRHEMLNEINRFDVMSDITGWIKSVIGVTDIV